MITTPMTITMTCADDEDEVHDDEVHDDDEDYDNVELMMKTE